MYKRVIFAVFLCVQLAAPALCGGSGTLFRHRASLWKGVTKVKLDNGLTVIINEDHAQPVVSVQTWVRVGSINETPETSGLSHFLEHLIFKGTEKYPGDAISRNVESKGGTINAATSKEYTQFHIDTQTSGFEEAVRILADAMANAAFPAADMERERPVVIEEIRRHKDNPGAVLYDLFNDAVFLKTPYRRNIIGTEEVIGTVSRERVAQYYHEWYVPANMVVSIAGDVRKKDALRLVEETFGRQKPGPVPQAPGLIEPPHSAENREESKDVEHEYLFSGFLGPDLGSQSQFAADIAATILGGSRSSRLYRRLREELQIVYSISASFWSQRGSGPLVVSAVFQPVNREKVAEAVREAVADLAGRGPSEEEMTRAREIIKSQWYFGLETYHDQAATLGYWELQGHPEIPEKYIAQIDRTTAKDVIAFFDEFYKPQGMSSALLIPRDDSK